jgi:hypothetical protein
LDQSKTKNELRQQLELKDHKAVEALLKRSQELQLDEKDVSAATKWLNDLTIVKKQIAQAANLK